MRIKTLIAFFVTLLAFAYAQESDSNVEPDSEASHVNPAVKVSKAEDVAEDFNIEQSATFLSVKPVAKATDILSMVKDSGIEIAENHSKSVDAKKETSSGDLQVVYGVSQIS